MGLGPCSNSEFKNLQIRMIEECSLPKNEWRVIVLYVEKWLDGFAGEAIDQHDMTTISDERRELCMLR